jgi:hypothetical protein
MMKNYMILGSTQGMELDEDPGGSDMMPFPREDAIMMVYDGGGCCVSSLSPRTLTHRGWEPRNTGV